MARIAVADSLSENNDLRRSRDAAAERSCEQRGWRLQKVLGLEPDLRCIPVRDDQSFTNRVAQQIGRHFTFYCIESDLVRLSRQSVSTFSRSFRKHTGTIFIQPVDIPPSSVRLLGRDERRLACTA